MLAARREIMRWLEDSETMFVLDVEFDCSIEFCVFCMLLASSGWTASVDTLKLFNGVLLDVAKLVLSGLTTALWVVV